MKTKNLTAGADSLIFDADVRGLEPVYWIMDYESADMLWAYIVEFNVLADNKKHWLFYGVPLILMNDIEGIWLVSKSDG